METILIVPLFLLCLPCRLAAIFHQLRDVRDFRGDLLVIGTDQSRCCTSSLSVELVLIALMNARTASAYFACPSSATPRLIYAL